MSAIVKQTALPKLKDILLVAVVPLKLRNNETQQSPLVRILFAPYLFASSN